MSTTVALDRTCRAFLGMGDISECQCEEWASVSTS